MEEENKNLENENTDENRGTDNESENTNTTNNNEGGENTNHDDGNKESESKNDERKFTQDDVNKAVNKALAKRLPPKEEMDAFREWKKSQQTEQEKQAEREKHYMEVDKENEQLKRENAVIKAGVNADDVDYVIFKVGKMEGDFEDNLETFLKDNEKYTVPKTKTVEGAKHEPKAKETITREELNKMTYKQRLEFKKKNPTAYEKAMRG